MSRVNRTYIDALVKTATVPEGINRQQMLSILNLFCKVFPSIDDGIVGFGGVLCLEGIRPITGDIDFQIDPKDVPLIESSGVFTRVEEVASGSGNTIVIYRLGVLDVHIASFGDMEIERYQNYPFFVMTLDSILYWKRKWNRPKDKADIINIEKVLKEREVKKREVAMKRYKELVDVTKVGVLGTKDVITILDKLSIVFPYTKESTIGDETALFLYGITDGLSRVTVIIPSKHLQYFEDMSIFTQSYDVDYGTKKTIWTLKLNSLELYFEDIAKVGDVSPTYNYIMPDLHYLERKLANSRDVKMKKAYERIKFITR